MILKRGRVLSKIGDAMRVLCCLLLGSSVLLSGCGGSKEDAVAPSTKSSEIVTFDENSTDAEMGESTDAVGVTDLNPNTGSVSNGDSENAIPNVAASTPPSDDLGVTEPQSALPKSQFRSDTKTQATKESKAAAVAAIKELGGSVTFDEHNPDKPVVGVRFIQATDAGLVHLKSLTSLQTLYLPSTKVTDVGLEHVKEMVGLQTLSLSGTQVTDAGLVHLKDLTSLQYLDLSGINVTDEGMVHLKDLTNLQTLNLLGAKVTGPGLKHLTAMKNLQKLNLTGTKVTDVGLEHLDGIRSLQTLYLRRAPITGTGLIHLKGLTSLRTLYLFETEVTDAGLVHLKGLTSLKSLNLKKTKVSKAGVEDLQSALPKCYISK